MSKLKLNIYGSERDEKGKRQIVKTYETDTIQLLYGPIEDVIGAVNLEKVENDAELAKIIMTVMKQIKPILLDVFYGLTEEELKMTMTDEIIIVVMQILSEAITGILSDDAVKNVMGGQKK